MLLAEQQKKNEYIQNLSNGELCSEIIFYQGLIEILNLHNRQMTDGEIEERLPRITWALEETIDYYNSLVFDMEQRFDGLSQMMNRLEKGELDGEALKKEWLEMHKQAS